MVVAFVALFVYYLFDTGQFGPISYMECGSDRECIETAIYEFKKSVKDSGKLNELRERQEFLKPSEKRRKIVQSAVRRQERLSEYEKFVNSLSNS